MLLRCCIRGLLLSAKAVLLCCVVFPAYSAYAQYSREPNSIPLPNEETAPVYSKRSRTPSITIEAPTVLAMPQSLPPVSYKTSGKDFIVSFASSVGSDDPFNKPYKLLYISSRSPIRGMVSLIGGTWKQPFVTDPNVLTVIALPAWAGLDRFETEQIYNRVFEITSEDEIAVYAYSHRSLSSDGYLVLPVEALGRQYSIASVRNALYYHGGKVQSTNPLFLDTLPRSEFLICGTQNATTIKVTPTANSYNGQFQAGKTYSFILNRGEVIEITARDTAKTGPVGGKLCWIGKLPGIDCDFTGSTVTADKPIAVFSGHERASTPDSLEFNTGLAQSVSRDHIIEQMPPMENWGKDFAFVPSSLAKAKGRPKSGDVIRVIAGYDLTTVTVDGIPIATLSKGTFKEFFLKSAAMIRTSQPALVMKYLQTCMEIDTTGDPDMTVMPPINNMSTYYTLPAVGGATEFSEQYISVVIDSDARENTSLNGARLDPVFMYIIPDSRYYHTTIRTSIGTQRIESILPCYAESYGYGRFDSYTFSGGGSFEYVHSLSAVDLDFGRIFAGSAIDSVTKVFSTTTQPLSISSEVYGYSWESGDSSVFSIIDTVRSPITVGAGQKIPVRFGFHPLVEGAYSALVRVWSNNKEPVFIKVTGLADAFTINLVPDTIDFGRVRVLRTKDSLFTISNTGSASLTLTNTTDFNNLLALSPFSVTNTFGSVLAPGDGVSVAVRFAPKTHNSFYQILPIKSDKAADKNAVFLGRGIDYELPSSITDFGKVRVGTISAEKDIAITNVGDDSTSIVSIQLVSGDVNDFILNASTLPTTIAPWLLGEFDSSNHSRSYKVKFAPKYDPTEFINKRQRKAIVKIVTPDDRPLRREYFDTLIGNGVEPYITATPLSIDFGTFVNPSITSSIAYDTLINIGSSEGMITKLRQVNPLFFSIKSRGTPLPANSLIGENGQINLTIEFQITTSGDFYDTIFIENDSRSLPIVYIQGKVRAGINPPDSIDLGTISNCEPVDRIMDLHNPSKVTVVIDTVFWGEGSGGFEFAGLSNFRFPINIAPDSSFSLPIRYVFPADSLSGTQIGKVIIHRAFGEGTLSTSYDTGYVTLNRKIIQLALSATQPLYNPNAKDAPFRIPVYLTGSRLGFPELDNDTVRIQFSNNLIDFYGIDRTGSLTELGKPGVPLQPDPIWNPQTRELLVPIFNAGISKDAGTNTLLFTIEANVFLTADTIVEAASQLTYTNQPCAFRVEKHLLDINYADECGDRTIRDLLLTKSVPISISDPHPNPASLNSSVNVGYICASDYMLSWRLFDASGAKILDGPTFEVKKGQGNISIPTSQLQSSGLYFITFTVLNAEGNPERQLSTKFNFTK